MKASTCSGRVTASPGLAIRGWGLIGLDVHNDGLLPKLSLKGLMPRLREAPPKGQALRLPQHHIKQVTYIHRAFRASRSNVSWRSVVAALTRWSLTATPQRISSGFRLATQAGRVVRSGSRS